MNTIREFAEKFAQLVADGKGDLPVAFARGGEDECVYGVEFGGLSEIESNNGFVTVYMVDVEGYEELGFIHVEEWDEDECEDEE